MLTQEDLNAIGGLVQECVHREIAPVRDELHQEIIASHDDLEKKIITFRDELHQEIVASHDDLEKKIITFRDELHQEIQNVRDELHQEIQREVAPIKYELRAIRHRLDNIEDSMKETKSAVSRLIDWADEVEHVVGVPL